MEPASKVSVPLDVVNRIAVNAPPEIVFDPADINIALFPFLLTVPADVQIFPDTFVSTMTPDTVSVIAAKPFKYTNAVVMLVANMALGAELTPAALPKYPVVSNVGVEPYPS